jgi:hypothetical protein
MEKIVGRRLSISERHGDLLGLRLNQEFTGVDLPIDPLRLGVPRGDARVTEVTMPFLPSSENS